MDISDISSAGGERVAREICDSLLEPFSAAVCAALREMASTEVVVQRVHQDPIHHRLGDLSAVVGLDSENEGLLILSFPEQTAAALAGRMLAGATDKVDETLVRDSVGEIANVVAGQAKAMLAETPYRYTFSLPRLVVGASDFRPREGQVRLVVAFGCDEGEFAMQLVLKL